MTDQLTRFLDAWATQHASWGQHDCALWTSDWVAYVTGKDGGSTWRGTYDDEAGCLAVLHRDGGLVGVMAHGAAQVGLQRGLGADQPVRGDIAVVGVRLAQGTGHLAAICTGPTWAALSERGVRYIRAQHVAFWRVPLAPSVLDRAG